MKPLKDEFGSRRADSITPQDLERCLADSADENDWAPATVNRFKALLSLVFRLGVQNGKIASNPAKLVKRRLENNARIRFLRPDEERLLRKVMSDQYPEHLPDVDFDNRVLTIALSKNGDSRHVPMNAAVVTAFQTLLEQSKGSNAVFVSKRNERLQGPRYWFEAAIKAANIEDFTWHCFRHTFASRLVMKGVDLRTVQELLGHRTITMTLRYAHLAPQHKLAAVERLCEVPNEQEKPTDTTTDTIVFESVLEQTAVNQ